MKPTRTWILIADGARARILSSEGRDKGLTPATAEFTGEKRASRDIGADRPGRVHDRAGPGRHAMEPRIDWHEFEKQQFAKHVAGRLNDAAHSQAYDRLVLVAPPKVLGDLRAALNKTTRALVFAELGKDLTGLSDHELPGHLEKIMPV